MAADVKVEFDEAHFTSLPSQTNIYGLTKVTDETEKAKILVASLKGQVTCVEYGNKWDNPTARELPFTYIPTGEAEIVSIDAFVRQSPKGCGLVVGISFILLNNVHSSLSKQKQFLNIYSSAEEGRENCLDIIAEGCQHIELDFVPFQLCHAQIKNGEIVETVFLLAGSDCKVHMYREVMDKTHQTFEKQTTEFFFPELQDLPSNALWIDIQRQSENKRLTAIGCQNGYVRLSVVDTSNEPLIEETWDVQHDGPITSVTLLSTSETSDAVIPAETDVGKQHLLVCCAIELCVLYTNVLDHGFDKLVTLPDSDKFDCVLCTCLADVDMDGNKELLLGTYGQELLVYKFPLDNHSVDMAVIWQRSFSSPLFAIEYLDMTGDGICEVVVASLSGLHILQHQLDEIAGCCTTRTRDADLADDQSKHTYK